MTIEYKDFFKAHSIPIENNERVIDPQNASSVFKQKGNLFDPSMTFVESVSDLPSPINSVITLLDNANYFFIKNVDLLGNRLVCGQNTVIIGGSSENCIISSTGLSAESPLVSSTWSLPMRSISLSHAYALNLNANGNANQAIDWFGVNFLNCAKVGTIAGYSNFIMTDCALLNSSEMTFDGTIGTVGFSQCIFSGQESKEIITIPVTATITRRFRIIYSAFVVPTGATGINFNSSATVPVDSYILDTVNFAGAGTYLSGVLYADNKALFVNNKGINNSSEVANYFMLGNVTPSDIITQGVAVKASGSTTAGIIEKFTHTANRATYTGAITRLFEVKAVASFNSGNGNVIGFYVAKNGELLGDSESYSTANAAGRAENVNCQALVSLSTNDFIEIWVENSSASTDVTVEFLNVIIKSAN